MSLLLRHHALLSASAKESPFVTFTTNKNGTFSPSISTSDSSIATWEVSGEISQTTNNPSFTLDGSDRTVNLKIVDFTKITLINVKDDGIKGALDVNLLTKCTSYDFDSNLELTTITNPINSEVITQYRMTSTGLITNNLSNLTGLGGTFTAQNNSSLTSITFPTSSQTFTIFNILNSAITGTLDLSTLTGLSGNFLIASCPNLTSITFPTSSQTFTAFDIKANDLTGIIDLTGLTGLGGQFRAYTNPNMTSLLLPNSSNSISLFAVFGCNLSTLDLSPLTNMSGQIQVQSNSNLSNLILPTSNSSFTNIFCESTAIGVLNWSNLTGTVTTIRIQNCGFTSAESDENIVLIDNNINLTSVLSIAGTNGVLTDGTVTGFDGLAAKDQLVIEGVTVNYN